MNNNQGPKIAIIGAGISGLVAAWCLSHHGYNVTIFEKESQVGGHAKAIPVEVEDQSLLVDIGFMVFNEKTYPNLVAIIEYLNQSRQTSDMSFSFSLGDQFSWSSDSLNTLFSKRSNWLNPSFYRMLYDIFRFNRQATWLVHQWEREPTSAKEKKWTVGHFLETYNYSSFFRDSYLLPMAAAVWSCPLDSILEFPLLFLLQFFYNHGFLQVFNRPQWYCLKGSSRSFLSKLIEDMNVNIRCNAPVAHVINVERNSDLCVRICLQDQTEEEFDQVIFATHSNTTSLLLSAEPNPTLSALLKDLPYSHNDIYIHCDEKWLPREKRNWSSWNFLSPPIDRKKNRAPCVTYWLNRLQNLPYTLPILETLNPWEPPEESKTFAHFVWEHPQYTLSSQQSQENLQQMQGKYHMWYCGAYCGYGFHEDGIVSGIQVASLLVGKENFRYFWNSSKEHVVENNVCHSMISTSFGDRDRWMDSLGKLCKPVVYEWLKHFVKVGRLFLVDIVHTSNGMESIQNTSCFGQEKAQQLQSVTIHVKRPRFYLRVLLFMDIGLAESYMYGDIELMDVEALLCLLNILIENRDQGGLNDWKYSLFRWTGGWINTLYLKWWRRNTVQNSYQNIRDHYDLSNDLFALFLGSTWMYSCALWRRPSDSLEDAQMAKIEQIISKLNVKTSHHVLEIGFGWGELAIQLVKQKGCRVTGITLSEEQFRLAKQRVAVEGLEDKIELQVIDYRLMKGQFDRIVSIEMLEAVGHEYLGDYFAALERLLKPNGLVVLQVISVPEYRYEAYRSSI
ncbi:cyclopropane-fatty-acyl-phospholipid synthase [Galdieria sulphuraria]|uniref:Cyclopropane-fatty-acyl-phospholipid synthase n=1 Tax=Galdieria sulphuraria TaxID=130081 RepID=M2XNX6_GALSU|nr:cyclopropane-fatty-acyl-phospholipid synthase [Galdieria sulphuraria]EME31852.1 cyclopropane-fatty-acyl-phospholipid synthase [Galdieria sulphuraria]|eukprot:XP_005708372.1 cyclopropane-fatty-acyl-phospholipid synthase [Galdieria sulphuraria]